MAKDLTYELSQPLDPKHVRKPSGSFGPKGDYIEGWHAIAEANEVFGFAGWSYSSDLTLLDQRQEKTPKGDDQWQVSYSCMCTVTAAGVTRQDVGYGSGFSKKIGDAHEGAMKEAATDALKRALRTFGYRFGLALYDKTKANVREPEPDWELECDRISEIVLECHTLQHLQKVWSDNAKILVGLKANAFSKYEELVALKDVRKSQVHSDPDMQAPPVGEGARH